jgi:hypothetical protein
MLRSLLIIFLFATGLLTSCSADEDVRPITAGGLQDSWTWVESIGGIAGSRQSPTTTGNQKQLEFGSDGTVRYYLNGRLVSTETYTIQTGNSIRTNQPTQLIVYGNGRKNSFEVHNNTLLLWDEVYDGYQHQYQR